MILKEMSAVYSYNVKIGKINQSVWNLRKTREYKGLSELYKKYKSTSHVGTSTSRIRFTPGTPLKNKTAARDARDVFEYVPFRFYAAHCDFCSRQCSLRVSSDEDKECRRSSRNVYWSFHLPYISALCSLVLHSLATFTVSDFSFRFLFPSPSSLT